MHACNELLFKEEIIAGSLLLLVLDGVKLVDTRTEVGRVTTEGDIEGSEEGIHAAKKALRSACLGFDCWGTLKDNHTVCKVGCHDKVVLNDESSFFGMHDESFDDFGCDNTLFRVKVCTRFIN